MTTITIPDEVLFASRMTEQEMAVELGVVMYDRGGVPLESAAETARTGRRQFAHLLASRDIAVDSADFRAGKSERNGKPSTGLMVDCSAHGVSVSETDVLTELAIVLYEREKLSVGWAARLAGMDKWAFNSLLASRGVPMHYDAVDLQHDLATLESLLGR